jgi:hypothetical protein
MRKIIQTKIIKMAGLKEKREEVKKEKRKKLETNKDQIIYIRMSEF